MAFDQKRLLSWVPLLFGISAWLGINSTFLQLPLIVKDAPEGWALPSYIVILVQIGNIGPLAYRLIQRCWRIKDSYLIYFLISVGMAGAVLTSCFYDKTIYFLGMDRSIPLFLTVLMFAILDCSSSVVFMPYMGRWGEAYLISYLTGVSVGGLTPSLVALGQGSKPYEYDCATNSSIPAVNGTRTAEPNFGVPTFFLMTLGIYVISLITFYCLDTMEIFKKQYANVTIGYGNEYTFNVAPTSDDNKNASNDEAGSTPPEEQLKKLSANNYRNLMILAVFMSFTYNAVLPAVQSYSTIPYGSETYHFSVVFSYIANTIAYLSTNFIAHSSLKMIGTLVAVQAVPAAYVLIIALQSPTPWLQGTLIGPILIVSF